jgi:hypothetical protein
MKDMFRQLTVIVKVNIHMKLNEFTELDASVEEKASRKLCKSSTPNAELGASNLASCKSQGLRTRTGKKSHKIGKKRITVGGKKLKGKQYGGSLPDYS